MPAIQVSQVNYYHVKMVAFVYALTLLILSFSVDGTVSSEHCKPFIVNYL